MCVFAKQNPLFTKILSENCESSVHSKVDLGPSLDCSVDLPKHNLDDIMNEGKTLNDKVKNN